MNKAYYSFKIILIQVENIVLIQDIQKDIYKGQAMVFKTDGKAFHQSSFFSLITKETEKKFMVKYIQQAHNFTVVAKYKSLFLHINLKLVPFASNLLVHILSVISILVGILSSSKSFVKYTLQNSLKIHKLRH